MKFPWAPLGKGASIAALIVTAVLMRAAGGMCNWMALADLAVAVALSSYWFNAEEAFSPDADDTGSPGYQAFIEAAAKDCRNCPSCSECPCQACMAGGVCDERECGCDEEEDDGYDPNGCPGCGGGCARACR